MRASSSPIAWCNRETNGSIRAANFSSRGRPRESPLFAFARPRELKFAARLVGTTWLMLRQSMCVLAVIASLAPGVAWGQTAAPGGRGESGPIAAEPMAADERIAGDLPTDDTLDDVDLLELDVPVVVTASRREQKITAVPHAISIITQEDIRRSGARSIPDALRLVPGVDVSDLAYGSAAVSPRGFQGFVSRQLLVLVDGRQIYDSLFGGTLWHNWPFQLEDIERIEVIRGPGGVTWGANAVFGVINIITKDPADQLGLTLTAGGGSRGTYKEHTGYAWADDKLRLRVSGEYEASDGFRSGGSILRGLEDDYKAGRTGVHAIYEHGPNDTFTVSGGNSLVDGGFPPTPMAGLGWTRNAGSQASFLLGKWTHAGDNDSQYEVTGYVNDFQASPGVPQIDYRYQQLALQFGHTFKLREAHTVAWGIDTRADLLDASNSDPFMLTKSFVSTGIVGVYLQDEWRLAPKWALTVGGRMDYEFYGGFLPSARAALSYDLSDNSMLYGAVSRAVQLPPAALRFLDIPLLNGLVRVTGERDVDEAALLAYEVGYRGKPLDRLETNLNLFWNSYNDLTTITPTLGPPGLVNVDFDNRGSSGGYGVELDGKYRATDRLTLLGHYTYQHLEWKSHVPYEDTDATTPPQHKFMVGARYSATDDLHLSSHLYYVDAVKTPNSAFMFVPRHVDPYFRLDLLAEYEFWNDRASVSVGVRNLLDDDHFEAGTLFLNNAEVPRMVFAELRLSFK